MTTSNHVLVGGSIALALHSSLLVIPLAFASHFVLDALPHYGYEGQGYKVGFKHKTTFIMEAFGLIGLLILLVTVNFFVWLTFIAAIVAVSPDFEWAYRYIFFERKNIKPKSGFFTRFHQKIQWCERKWGIVFEILFFIVGYTVLTKDILHR